MFFLCVNDGKIFDKSVLLQYSLWVPLTFDKERICQSGLDGYYKRPCFSVVHVWVVLFFTISRSLSVRSRTLYQFVRGITQRKDGTFSLPVLNLRRQVPSWENSEFSFRVYLVKVDKVVGLTELPVGKGSVASSCYNAQATCPEVLLLVVFFLIPFGIWSAHSQMSVGSKTCHVEGTVTTF